LPQPDVMLLGTCKILQNCSKRRVLYYSQVNLNGLLHDDTGLGWALSQHLLYQRHAHEGSNDLFRPAGGSQYIDVSDGFPRPAKATCCCDVLQASHASQVGQNIIDNRLGSAVENASAALFVSFNGL